MNVIGVDVGGSKTHGVRVESGRVVAEATVGSANISSVGPEEAARQLQELARRLHRETDAVCVGAAGANLPHDELRVRALVEQAFPGVPARIVHDTNLVLSAAGLDTGIVVISGTGSAVWGRNPQGDEARADGWGYLLGDDGSAFGVIRAALRHALGRLDAGDGPDPLTDRLLKTCGVQDAGELLEFFYRAPARREWAARASIVFDLLAEGDPVAGALVDQAARDLARPTLQVAHRLTAGQPTTPPSLPAPAAEPGEQIPVTAPPALPAPPVVLAGGLLTHQPELRRRLEAELSAEGMSDVRLLDRAPVFGAVRLAEEMIRS